MIKKNDVVAAKGEGYFMPGRVWKILPDGRAVVICCGLHIRIYRPEDLEITDYKGRWLQSYHSDLRERFPVFLRMTTLRKLKQRASGYHPDIWARKRPKGTLPRYTAEYKRRQDRIVQASV